MLSVNTFRKLILLLLFVTFDTAMTGSCLSQFTALCSHLLNEDRDILKCGITA